MFIDEQVIFVHNPRTSGTSIRRALLCGLEPDEHISWPGNLASETTRNRKHDFAGTIREQLSSEIWDSRFKFSVVRNPHDRMVSLYHLFRRPIKEQRCKLGKFTASLRSSRVENLSKSKKQRFRRKASALSFKEWIRFCDEYNWNNCGYLDAETPLTRIQQVRWFDGLNKVFHFENREEINEFLRAGGYHAPQVENASEHEPWEAYYDEETFDLVEDMFKQDLARFY